MQKRRFPAAVPFDVSLPADFPAWANYHTQAYCSLRDLHVHSHAEIGLCLDGSGVFFIGERVYPFQKGDVSFIAPETPHIAQSDDETPSRWWFLSYRQPFFTQEMARRDGVLRDEDCRALFDILRREMDRLGGGNRTISASLLLAGLSMLARASEASTALREDTGLTAVLPALHYMAQHYTEPIPIPRLAALCHLSESHFRTLFRENVGSTPLAYLTRMRMLAAAEALRNTDMPVTDIAVTSGYADISAFNRQFKRFYGLPPREYRKM